MGYVETFRLNGVLIKTTVADDKETVDEILRSFLRESDNATKVIGFDIEWTLFSDKTIFETQCATVHLCNGHSCLIIQLLHMFWLPISLLNFLRQPNYTFVGIGIKDNLAKLEKKKHYGICCRNAVELGHLAATLMGNPRLNFCCVDELALAVNEFDLRNQRPLTAINEDWGKRSLSKELAKLATINAYSYYKIGSTLLGGGGN